MTKTVFCKYCNRYKLRKHFYKSHLVHYRYMCKKCSCVRQAQWATNNRHKIAAFGRKFAYNLTPEQYNKMLRKQKGLCGICKKKMKPPQVDHKHKTKQVRGLLCHRCNVMLGFALENRQILCNAILYLKKSEEKL